MLKLTTDKQTDKQTNKQTDKQTGQKQYAPDHSIRGHKKIIIQEAQRATILHMGTSLWNGTHADNDQT